ncbi:Gfo/Idh/MocA family oxidoreductase (plasmid) [Agrobacterium sp. rho-8.1]|nr:Gfo/Idh/MocA family oxidoreductase [Agrobacterium sp. rho-8.1]
MASVFSSASAGRDWEVLSGPMSSSNLKKVIDEFLLANDLSSIPTAHQTIEAFEAASGQRVVITWRRTDNAPVNAQRYAFHEDGNLEILADLSSCKEAKWGTELIELIRTKLYCFSEEEIAEIKKSMPLLGKSSIDSKECFDGWSLIFRDHFVENTLGFLLAIVNAGIPPEWILALTKGDRTSNRHRIDATLRSKGIRTGVLDNALIDTTIASPDALLQYKEPLDDFIDSSRAAGKKVLIIDDGGLVAWGYGSKSSARRVDGALELTIAGLKRIAQVSDIDIPILNLAKSELKQQLAYPEIVDSCVRRIQTIIPGFKQRGRSAIVLGYGSLGEKLTSALHSIGMLVHVVEKDILRLIKAAEAGYATHRNLSDAIDRANPFLIAGTTGEIALTADDVDVLKDETVLAPFATRDFSILKEILDPAASTTIPNIGKRYKLDDARQVTVLGDGRSLNLFEADAIPNEGYDAYRAGTLIAAAALCQAPTHFSPGLHLDRVNEIIRSSGLYERYYDRYVLTKDRSPEKDRDEPEMGNDLQVCIVGYGVAGRLHARILLETGSKLSIVDPKYQGLPDTFQVTAISELSQDFAHAVQLWSICTPTAEHLSSLQQILKLNPRARVLLEKPACQAHEIPDLVILLQQHPEARLCVIDQYKHTLLLPALLQALRNFEPSEPITGVDVTFNKDRRRQIEKGRFVDRSYGVLGYEWLHMLTIVREILPESFQQYVSSNPVHSLLRPTYSEALFIAALTEETVVARDGKPVSIRLSSNIVQPVSEAAFGPMPRPASSGNWQKKLRPLDDRVRYARITAGITTVTLYFDPVTTVGGWQLPRNYHRLTVERQGNIVADYVLPDAPLHNAIRHGVSTMLTDGEDLGPIDLRALRRIALLADQLREPDREDIGTSLR